jgi:hypothetical protein
MSLEETGVKYRVVTHNARMVAGKDKGRTAAEEFFFFRGRVLHERYSEE